MSQETNPFRLSMLQRSQSPIEDPFEPLAGPHASVAIHHPAAPPAPAAGGAPGSSTLFSSGSSTGAGAGAGAGVGSRSSSGNSSVSNHSAAASASRAINPFRVDLADCPASPSGPSGPSDAGTTEPPPYFESESRRHSEPSLTRDEKHPARDEGFREGYEEGMRLARERERQRRREARERRAKEAAARGERPPAHRSGSGDRESSSASRSRRARSKSESAGHRHPHGSSSSSSSRRPKPQSESLDVIDKMDITGLYGGSSFHHDGPFDACAPHRNKTSKRIVATPISAFPADGPNNSLAVEDPRLSAYRKEESVYGRTVHNDPPPELTQMSFDPTDRGAKVHGERTMGLGSTTFIDGTPASRDAIEQAGRQRSQSLGRSRSLLRRPADDFGEEPKSLLSRVRSLRVSRN